MLKTMFETMFETILAEKNARSIPDVREQIALPATLESISSHHQGRYTTLLALRVTLNKAVIQINTRPKPPIRPVLINI